MASPIQAQRQQRRLANLVSPPLVGHLKEDEFGHDFERELMLYMVHGLLHLAGHEDATDIGRSTMDKLQHSILNQVW